MLEDMSWVLLLEELILELLEFRLDDFEEDDEDDDEDDDEEESMSSRALSKEYTATSLDNCTGRPESETSIEFSSANQRSSALLPVAQ